MAITPKTGDIVSFQLVINSLNGDERTQVKVSSGSLDYATARLIDRELSIKHTALFPYFKDLVGNIDDPSVYQYMAVQGANGVVEIIGIPWVKESTYRIIESRVAIIQVTNFREEFRAPIQKFFSDLGAVYTFTVKDS